MNSLKTALKEWSIAVDALEQGDTILLLRKGGIREEGGRFSVPYAHVLLYPTFEHQNPDLLKPQYSDRVQVVESGWHPETIKISSFANITDIIQVTDPETVKAMLPFHIWNERFIEERLKWKPRSSLYLLLLRVFKLAEVHSISYQDSYGGCRSWIELASEITLEKAVPVLSEETYRDRCHQIQQRLDPEMQKC